MSNSEKLTATLFQKKKKVGGGEIVKVAFYLNADIWMNLF